MSRFTAIPAVPVSGLPQWKVSLYNALKQNVELLIAQRNEADRSSKALLEGEFAPPSGVTGSVLLTLTPPLTTGIANLANTAGYYKVGSVVAPGAYVADTTAWTDFETSASYRATGTSVRSLKEDVAILHDRVTNLVSKLRS